MPDRIVPTTVGGILHDGNTATRQHGNTAERRRLRASREWQKRDTSPNRHVHHSRARACTSAASRSANVDRRAPGRIRFSLRSTSGVRGAISPFPNRTNFASYLNGLPSVQPNDELLTCSTRWPSISSLSRGGFETSSWRSRGRRHRHVTTFVPGVCGRCGPCLWSHRPP